MDENEIEKKLGEIGKPYSMTAKDLRGDFDNCKKESNATDLAVLGMVKKRLQDALGFPEETPVETPPAAEVSAKKEMDADDFLKRASQGNWVSADVVNEGDRMTVLEGIHEDSETFEGKTYLVAPVRLGTDDYNLRLGVRNVKRLRDAFGSDMKKWTNRDIEVAAIEGYKVRGATQKGLILRGVKESA